jgi:DNA-binding transcriptional LysR family regulator
MIKNPNFELFRVIIAVAESKNFYEAAKKLEITQPSVSNKLKELEAQLPLPLFQLKGRRKVLTHYGRSLYEIAKRTEEELVKEIETLHRHYAEAKNLTIKIAGRNEILEYLFPQFQFEGKIELIGCNSRKAVDLLINHECDIAIGYSAPDSTEIYAKKIIQSKSHFVIHKKLLGNRKLNLDLINDLEFIKRTPCISYDQNGHMLNDWSKFLGLTIGELNVSFVSEDWRLIQKLVDMAQGYAILPGYIQSQSRDVMRLEMPSKVLPAFTFYAYFEKGLKKIKPFQKILEF